VVLGVIKWFGFRRVKIQTGEVIIFSGRDDDIYQGEVAILNLREVADCMDC